MLAVLNLCEGVLFDDGNGDTTCSRIMVLRLEHRRAVDIQQGAWA